MKSKGTPTGGSITIFLLLMFGHGNIARVGATSVQHSYCCCPGGTTGRGLCSRTLTTAMYRIAWLALLGMSYSVLSCDHRLDESLDRDN